MHFTSEKRLHDGVLERGFNLGGIPGILWTPTSVPAPLILVGHPGGLRQMYPRLAGRALHAAEYGFASVAIELPGSGDRPRSAAADQARADLRRALGAVSRSMRSSKPSSSRLSKRRSRNGKPRWTQSFPCPRSAVRSGSREE